MYAKHVPVYRKEGSLSAPRLYIHNVSISLPPMHSSCNHFCLDQKPARFIRFPSGRQNSRGWDRSISMLCSNQLSGWVFQVGTPKIQMCRKGQAQIYTPRKLHVYMVRTYRNTKFNYTIKLLIRRKIHTVLMKERWHSDLLMLAGKLAGLSAASLLKAVYFAGSHCNSCSLVHNRAAIKEGLCSWWCWIITCISCFAI